MPRAASLKTITPPRRRSRRGELTARLVEIPFLLATRPHTAEEIARHFRVSTRTVRRAIDALSLHNHITEERIGRSLYYRFREDYRFVPPALTPAELATLLLAQESIATTGLTALGTPFGEYARTLLEKVRHSLPAALRERLDALSRVYGSSAVSAKDFAPHARTLERLTEAVLESRVVRLLYHSLNRDSIEERTVEPYAVYFDPDGATLKLIGFDHKRRAIIPLSVDHIRAIRVTSRRFTRPVNFDLRRYLTENCFNGIHGTPVRVRLRARGVVARIFAERTFHSSPARHRAHAPLARRRRDNCHRDDGRARARPHPLHSQLVAGCRSPRARRHRRRGRRRAPAIARAPCDDERCPRHFVGDRQVKIFQRDRFK